MLAQWLTEAKSIVVFSGAGMSTESGVPDFRSANGLWRTHNPQKLASVDAMEFHREQFIEFYRARIQAMEHVEPHKGYEMLNQWARKFALRTIITQNTDGLHDRAGNPNIIPLHGTITVLHCQRCKLTHSTDHYLQGIHYCQCGGFLRPSVVLFGEYLQEQHLAAAEQAATGSDLFIVLGSSLAVSPANYYPMLAKQKGARLVIVNYDPTPLDRYADLVVNNQSIGDYLQEVNHQL